MLSEWGELGKTGSTGGQYGKVGQLVRRRNLGDVGWLIEHWGIEPDAMQAFLEGAIQMGNMSAGHVDAMLAHCPDAPAVLNGKCNLVRMAVLSSCATSYECVELRARMVSDLIERGFKVSARDKTQVADLCREAEAIHKKVEKAKRVEKQKAAAKAARKAEVSRRVHTGVLETHEADLSNCDSTELRHVDRYFKLWSCCKRGEREPGCTEPK